MKPMWRRIFRSVRRSLEGKGLPVHLRARRAFSHRQARSPRECRVRVRLLGSRLQALGGRRRASRQNGARREAPDHRAVQAGLSWRRRSRCRGALPPAPWLVTRAAGQTRSARLGVPIERRREKCPRPPPPQKLSLSTMTSAVGWRVMKPPWGWLLSTATNSVR